MRARPGGEHPEEANQASGRVTFTTLAILLLGWSAYALGTFLASLPKLPPEQLPEHGIATAARAFLGFLITLAVLPLYRRMLARRASLAATAAAVFLVSAVGGPLWFGIYIWGVLPLTVPQDVPDFPWPAFPRSSLESVFVLLAWSAVYIAFRIWKDAQDAEKERLAMTSRSAELEVALLRHQLGSHFLFNALTSIKAAIPPDAGTARSMLEGFVDFLRLVLRTSAHSRIPIHDDMELAERYLAIEKRRLEDRLMLEVDVSRSIDPALRMPGPLLQPLAENAIRHGAGDLLRVRLSAEVRDGALFLRVSNSGKLRTDPVPLDAVDGTGFGLRYVRERIASVAGSRLSLDESDGMVHCTIELPVGGLSHGR